MQVVLFVHSILSDWNHGNAHFLRGVATELVRRGHRVRTVEAADAWSVVHLERDTGSLHLDALRRAYPELAGVEVVRRPPGSADVDAALDGADLVLVHEWNDPDLIARVGRRRARGGRFVLLFHDTHHRSVTRPEDMAAFDLSAYDGVLAFGEAIREVYVRAGWSRRVWTWHEAADVHRFRPLPRPRREQLVWVGNWGDEERTRELASFLLRPAEALGLTGTVHGVRYPPAGRRAVARAGLRFGGWLPNFRVPEVFAGHRVTVHVPRRPYVESLPGIPTIRPFEALACGIPLVSAAWSDREGLFRPGVDFLVARSEGDMRRHLADVLRDADLAASLARHGRETILARHTCGHRVDELLTLYGRLRRGPALRTRPSAGGVR